MMLGVLPLSLVHMLALAICPAVAFIHDLPLAPRLPLEMPGMSPAPDLTLRRPSVMEKRDVNANGSDFLWTLEDSYMGSTFFDTFTFFTYPDPTHGLVNYVNESFAFANNLSYVGSDGKVVMKGDDTTWLPEGAYRNSVRVQSNKSYGSGSLFILDIDRAPWGCGVWPSFWTVGPDWPWNGEIDIIEGVHDNEHNQVTWHTAPGCWLLNSTTNFTGQAVGLDCDATINDNAGCATIEWSRASYGPYFESQGGGVFAMKWDENNIAVWSFYRAAIPQDIIQGTPNTSNWGTPVALLEPYACNLTQYFAQHNIVFDITFCGDWAGNSYASAPGCPGTCPERIMDPTNFENASWIVNYLKVFNKVDLTGPVVRNSASRPVDNVGLFGWAVSVTVLSVALSMSFMS